MYAFHLSIPIASLRQRVVDGALRASPPSRARVPRGLAARRRQPHYRCRLRRLCPWPSTEHGGGEIRRRRLTADDLVRVDLAGQPVAPARLGPRVLEPDARPDLHGVETAGAAGRTDVSAVDYFGTDASRRGSLEAWPRRSGPRRLHDTSRSCEGRSLRRHYRTGWRSASADRREISRGARQLIRIALTTKRVSRTPSRSIVGHRVRALADRGDESVGTCRVRP